MKQKRSARIAMRRKKILSKKLPAAGGETRKWASFLIFYEVSMIKTSYNLHILSSCVDFLFMICF